LGVVWNSQKDFMNFMMGSFHCAEAGTDCGLCPRNAAFGGRMRPPFSLEKKMRRARCKRNVFDLVLWCLLR
jgi:hypothetical protein